MPSLAGVGQRVPIWAVVTALLVMPVSGMGQTTSEWRASGSLVSGNSNCNSGGRATIRIVNNLMMLFAQGMSYPNWRIELAADGSASKTVVYEVHPPRPVQDTVPAGSAPRKVRALYVNAYGGYDYAPD